MIGNLKQRKNTQSGEAEIQFGHRVNIYLLTELHCYIYILWYYDIMHWVEIGIIGNQEGVIHQKIIN